MKNIMGKKLPLFKMRYTSHPTIAKLNNVRHPLIFADISIFNQKQNNIFVILKNKEEDCIYINNFYFILLLMLVGSIRPAN